MAGESPDRSKERESSAERTPGSGGSVPEPRDPRLAVAREKDSSGGGTDTATKILSIPDGKRQTPPTEPPAPEEPADAEPQDTPDEDAALRDAVSAWVRGSDTPPEKPERKSDTPTKDTGAKADTKAKAEAATKADAEAATETEAEAATEADAGAATETEAEAGTKADAGAATKAEAEAGTKADAGAATKAEAEAGTKADAGAATKAEAEAGAEADAEAGAETEAEAATKAEAGAGTEAEAEAGAEADAEATTEAEAEAGAEVGGEAEAEEAGDGPEAADGEDTPQGPPAADDETRTGGAGGNTDAEGEAEADKAPEAPQAKAPQAKAPQAKAPQAKPVDQPTAVFKSVRPKKPEVDQPTTMLKLGGTPKAPESDSERTSKFVALKNDMRPATKPQPDAKPDAKPDATTPVPQVGPERTTQQPLPPKPPLDLLAELTNTPPPPETPVRTLMRRVKIWTPLVLLLVIVLGVVQTLRPLPRPTLDLTAKDSYSFDGAKTDIPWPSQGQAALDVQGIGSFGSSGTQKPVPIASVAKVMTAYLILRDHPLKSGADGPKIKIDRAAEQQSKAGKESTVDVSAGDSVSQREALESILIASANNVARLLARWDAGSEKAFVTKMNATAKSLGMTNTTYTDPSGLTDSTVSTAVDQVKLAKAAMTEPAFREVAAMMSYDDYKGVNRSNWNQLVGHNDVVGIKTGTTTSALGNLVFAAKKKVGGETRTIVGAVLRQPAGGPENTILSAALYGGDQLIRAAQGALKPATILKKGDVVGYVDDGLGGRTPVVATKDVTAAGWSGLKVRLSFASDPVPHTAKAGTKVGTLTVGDGSAGAVKVPVALEKDLAEPGFAAKLTRLG